MLGMLGVIRYNASGCIMGRRCNYALGWLPRRSTCPRARIKARQNQGLWQKFKPTGPRQAMVRSMREKRMQREQSPPARVGPLHVAPEDGMAPLLRLDLPHDGLPPLTQVGRRAAGWHTWHTRAKARQLADCRRCSVVGGADFCGRRKDMSQDPPAQTVRAGRSAVGPPSWRREKPAHLKKALRQRSGRRRRTFRTAPFRSPRWTHAYLRRCLAVALKNI